MTNKVSGPLLTVNEACAKAGISLTSLRSYVKKGHLEVHFEGGMVYYRDLLRAAWTVANGKKRSK
jgi:hypothetical protein